MKIIEPTPYIPPELDIITFESNDIVTTSGFESDDNILESW